MVTETEAQNRLTKLFIGMLAVLLLFVLWTAMRDYPSFLTDVMGVANAPAESAALVSCTDGVKNQDEGAVDCGGSCAACAAGMACNTDNDCGYRMACADGTCEPLEWQSDGCQPLVPTSDAQAENLNIVFAGIGYTSKQDFLSDAKRAAGVSAEYSQYPGLLFYEPMRSFKDSINLWYIDAIAPLPQYASVNPTDPDCRTRCKTTLGEEYCPSPNRQVIYLCNAKCDMSAEMGRDLYVGKSVAQPYGVVHGFGHSYGFLEDTRDDSLMGNYLRLSGRQPLPDDFSPEGKAQITERLQRHRGKDFEPWYMVWIVFDRDFNIVAAWENPASIGETRRLPAPYILRMNGGRLSYVFDFDVGNTIVTDRFNPHRYAVRREESRFTEVPLPLKLSKLSADKLRLEGYSGEIEHYTIDIMAPSGELLKRIPAEELAKFLKK